MALAWEEVAATSGLTYEDYILFPEDGRRHELIGGALHDTSANNWTPAPAGKII